MEKKDKILELQKQIEAERIERIDRVSKKINEILEQEKCEALGVVIISGAKISSQIKIVTKD